VQEAVLIDTFPLGTRTGRCSTAGARTRTSAGVDDRRSGRVPRDRCRGDLRVRAQRVPLPQLVREQRSGPAAAAVLVPPRGPASPRRTSRPQPPTGPGLIWSPRSNVSLYGDTARVATAARLGVTIALGTDWVVSGSMNLLRELRCADQFDSDYLNDFFEDRDLWRMVTARPAELAAMDDVIGTIAPGTVADIAIFDGSLSPTYRAVINAGAPEWRWSCGAGTTLYGDTELVEALRGGAADCDPLDVCGRAKKVCLVSEIGQTLPQLQIAVGDAYPLYFCGDPTGEPTCGRGGRSPVSGSTVYDGLPTADDPDGDGIPTASDNCPVVFNPVRPMDAGAQPDADGDGAGDACDPCPLAAGVPGVLTRNGRFPQLRGTRSATRRSRVAGRREAALADVVAAGSGAVRGAHEVPVPVSRRRNVRRGPRRQLDVVDQAEVGRRAVVATARDEQRKHPRRTSYVTAAGTALQLMVTPTSWPGAIVICSGPTGTGMLLSRIPSQSSSR